MERYTAFSTAPLSAAAAVNAAARGGGGGNNPVAGNASAGDGSAPYSYPFSSRSTPPHQQPHHHLSVHHTTQQQQQPQQQQQQQQQQQPMGNSSSPSSPSGLMFSTAATPMVNHHAAGAVPGSALGAQFGSLHMSTTIDTGANGGIDSRSLESIAQTLSALRNIAEGRPPVPLEALVDPARPAESARELSMRLNGIAPVSRRAALGTIAGCMTTPQHLAIVSGLDENYRNEVRDLVLQELLAQLTRAGDEPMPVCAEMLAELARLNLVRLNGVAAAVAQFLSQPGKRAGLAVLGRMAERYGAGPDFLREIQATNRIEPMLCELYKDPQYEYDVVAITRLLGGAEAERTTASLRKHTTIQTQPAPAACTGLQYFRGRDELLSCHANGSIVFWGGPDTTRTAATPLAVRKEVIAADDRICTALASPLRGQYCAAAIMPCPRSGPLRAALETRRAAAGFTTVAPRTNPGVRVYTCMETTGAWTEGVVGGAGCIIERPSDVVITALAAMPNYTVITAETTSPYGLDSALGGGGGGGSGTGRFPPPVQQMNSNNNSNNSNSNSMNGSHLRQHGGGAGLSHNLVMLDAETGESLVVVPAAHTDYITALTTCEDNEQVLLSGGRDRTVKLWDTRVSNHRGGGGGGGGGGAPVSGMRHGPVFTLDTLAANGAGGAAAAAGGGGGGASNKANNNSNINSAVEAGHHSDTISSLYTFRNFIFTGSLDGAMSIWDTRRLAAPVAARRFAAPVLDITALEADAQRVATARGLYLVSLETMSSVDVIPNVAFTQLHSGETGHVLFAAGQDGISVFSFSK